jgi:toxin ParE1/3/4
LSKYELIFSKAAELDLHEIVNYYETRNRRFVADLYKTIKSRILELSEIPERGRQVPELEQQGIENYRELIEGNYRIVYSITGLRVAIHSIVDSRRNLDEVLVKKILSHYEK